MSSTIDREGSGVIPDAGSKSFRQVEPVPRARAQQYRFRFSLREGCTYYGGLPVCPVCLKPNAVRFSGRRFTPPHAGFHCLRCLVWWYDTKFATCFVCDAVFRPEPKSDSERMIARMSSSGRSGEYLPFFTCFHLNQTASPFCPSCESKIGTDSSHRRRTLRRMVGLR